MVEGLNEYIAKQRAKGVKDVDIRQALIASGWQGKLVDEALVPTPRPDTPPPFPGSIPTAPSAPLEAAPAPATSSTSSPSRTHLNASQVLLVVGLALVVVAATVIVFYSWATFSPLARFLVAAIPNLLLLAIGYYASRQSNLAHIDEGTTAIGLLLLPITLGTFYYQFGIFPQIDSTLLLVSAASSLPILIIYDIWRKQRPIAVLMIMNALAVAIFFGLNQEWESLTWAVVGVLVGIASLAIAILCERINNQNHLRSLQIVAAVAFFFFVPYLVSQLLGGISFFGSDSIGISLSFAFLAGIPLLLLASSYRWLFKNLTATEYQLQRFLQFGAMAVILLPLITLILTQSVLVLLALVISALIILLAMAVGVNLLFVCGVLGIVVSLLVLLAQQLTDIRTPIFLFVLGFVAIGLSIFLGRLKLARQTLYNEQLAKSLGIISDQEQELLASSEAVHQQLRPGFIILIIVLLFFGLPLFGNIAGLFISNRAKQSPVSPTPTPVVRTPQTQSTALDPCGSQSNLTTRQRMAICQFSGVTYTKPAGWAEITATGTGEYFNIFDQDGLVTHQVFRLELLSPVGDPTALADTLKSKYFLQQITVENDAQTNNNLQFLHYLATDVAGNSVEIFALPDTNRFYIFMLDYGQKTREQNAYTALMGVINSVKL